MKIQQQSDQKQNIMLRIASTVIRMRFVIFLLFTAAAVYCVLSVGRVQVNSDISAFLPADTETRRGLTVMEEEFVNYGTAQVMVSDIDYDSALRLADELRAAEHVTGVTFDDTGAHFRNNAALFSISVDAPKDSADAAAALEGIKASLSGYDVSISSDIGKNYSNKIAGEMGLLLALSAAVILVVLLFTSRSYFEVVIFGIVFVFAALLNMGTNFWLGEISSITNTIAVIMQLALAIDYAIIFAHRYQDEAALCTDDREAVTRALAKSIVEVSSSALTTISGLVALTLMQFRLGYDLGIVLSKGIICSMLTVFFLMPGLTMLFPRALKKTRHRSFVPNIEGRGRLLMKKVPVFLIVFALILPLAVYFSSRTEYAFHDSSVTELVYSEEREAMHKINDTFENNTAVAVIVPGGDFESEKELLMRLAKLDGVKSATGLANIEVMPGMMLTDECTAARFAALAGVDEDQAVLLYKGYAVQHAQFDAMNDPDAYKAPLVKVLVYLMDLIDQGVVPLNEAQMQTVNALRGSLERGVAQLMGKHYDRLVMVSSLPAEGEKSVALVEQARSVAEEYYGKGNVLITGEITSARDLRDSYKSDSVLIAALTVIFVFLILLVTFRSLVAAAIMVFVIQGSIWINFSIPYLCGMVGSFVTNMIVSAIQMGATIDYAIVIMNRYRALRTQYDKSEAMTKAVNESFPTVITSGAIMAVAGFLIAYMVSDAYVGHIGHAVGRGAVISMIVVLSVLPQLIVLCDKLIDKTTLRLKRKGKPQV